LLFALLAIFSLLDVRVEFGHSWQAQSASDGSAAFIAYEQLAQTTLSRPVWPVPEAPPKGGRRDAVARASNPAAGLRAWSKEEVIELIRRHSASYPSLDVNLALRISFCESGWRWDARNPHSTASGVFQYLAGTWANTAEGRRGVPVMDADANVRMAISHIAVHGTSPWNASKGCWNA
jgi:hypothetical protein